METIEIFCQTLYMVCVAVRADGDSIYSNLNGGKKKHTHKYIKMLNKSTEYEQISWFLCLCFTLWVNVQLSSYKFFKLIYRIVICICFSLTNANHKLQLLFVDVFVIIIVVVAFIVEL